MPNINRKRLCSRFKEYCEKYDVSHEYCEAIGELIMSEIAATLFDLPEREWNDVLVNDAYKASMHSMYAAFMTGVSAQFALHIRKSPISLLDMSNKHPSVYQTLVSKVEHLSSVVPYGPDVELALDLHMPALEISPIMRHRSDMYRVAPIVWSAAPLSDGETTDFRGGFSSATAGPNTQKEQRGRWLSQVTNECQMGVARGWLNRRDKDISCIAAGPLEAASHAETSVMQLVQEAVIQAQVEEIRKKVASGASAGIPRQTGGGVWPDETELLASSLARLAHVIAQLNSVDHGRRVSLFAGRRSSSKLYLVLQNLAFAKLVNGYSGTSSIYAAAVLCKVWDRLGYDQDERFKLLGPLVGTHAHEQSSVLQQLLADVDAQAGQEARQSGGSGPIPVSSVLGHLMFIAATGRLDDTTTALADTFSTAAWLAVATAADVPQGFIEYMQQQHGTVVAPGCKVFDLIRTWRVDSGSYEQIADLIVSTWERRCQEISSVGSGNAGAALPRPILMHSNLSSVDEVLQVAALPERIRPDIVAFGSLADGFFPLLPPKNNTGSKNAAGDLAGGDDEASYSIQTASVVMKAVQARAANVNVTQISALKGGDVDPGSSDKVGKLEVDPRLDDSGREEMRQLAEAMRKVEDLDHGVASKWVSTAWDQVCGQGLLQS